MLHAQPEKKKEKFWQWTAYSDYLLFVCALGASIGLSTVFLGQNPLYQTFLGLASSMVEAGLGVPQFLLNYQRQNTSGLS